MLNSAELRRQCKRAARLELQRGGFWKCIGAMALMAVPSMLLAAALNIKMTPMMDMLEKYLLDESVQLSQYMEYAAQIYLYLGIFAVISLFIISPLTFGAMHYCMARAHGQQGEMSDVIIGFSRLKKYLTAIKTDLCVMLFSLLWTLPLVGGATALGLGLLLLAAKNSSSISLIMFISLLTYALIIAAAVYATARTMRYQAAYFLLIEDEDMGSWRAVRESTRLFRGSTWELFKFQLSFLGWQILSMMSFGLLDLYVFPYRQTAFIHYVDALRAPELPEQIESSFPA